LAPCQNMGLLVEVFVQELQALTKDSELAQGTIF